MIRLLICLALLPLALAGAPAAQSSGLTFYLQLIRGNDQNSPPTQSAKPIGPVLTQKLSSVFKWKNYWELKRDCITIKQGGRLRKRLSAQHDVEIELPNPDTFTIRIYLNGHLTRARTQPARDAFCVAGGNAANDQSWFIVVRRDAPLDAEKHL
jgi:hypothetical protein